MVFFERIDAVPPEDSLSFEFNSWCSVFVDSINEVIRQIEEESNKYNNGLVAPSFTTAEIALLSVDSPNGTLWYDITTNELKAKINNAIVVLA